MIARKSQLMQMTGLVKMPHCLPMCHFPFLPITKKERQPTSSTGKASGTQFQTLLSLTPSPRRPVEQIVLPYLYFLGKHSFPASHKNMSISLSEYFSNL
jgi:hypothetical protein